MKTTFAMVLLLGIICTVVLAQKNPINISGDKIDNVLRNDRILTNYIKCLLDKGACTREGRELKSKWLHVCLCCMISIAWQLNAIHMFS